MIRLLPLCLIAFSLTAAAQTREQIEKAEVKTTRVAGNVYMLEAFGGNIGVSVGDDGIVIIDTQFAMLAPKIREALAKITKQPVRYVINTHHHGDHVGGNLRFTETPIIAHQNVRKRVSGMQLQKADGTSVGFPVSALPVITFTDQLELHLNGEQLRALHLPSGHTDGDSVIFFNKSKVVHLGDLYFAGGRFPFIDVEDGGSVDGYIANVEKVAQELPADWKIIPGHGPISTPAELKQYVQDLKAMRDAVAKGVATGKTAEQLKQERVLRPWEKHAWQFIDTASFIDTLYGAAKAGR